MKYREYKLEKNIYIKYEFMYDFFLKITQKKNSHLYY